LRTWKKEAVGSLSQKWAPKEWGGRNQPPGTGEFFGGVGQDTGNLVQMVSKKKFGRRSEKSSKKRGGRLWNPILKPRIRNKRDKPLEGNKGKNVVGGLKGERGEEYKRRTNHI